MDLMRINPKGWHDLHTEEYVVLEEEDVKKDLFLRQTALPHIHDRGYFLSTNEEMADERFTFWELYTLKDHSLAAVIKPDEFSSFLTRTARKEYLKLTL